MIGPILCGLFVGCGLWLVASGSRPSPQSLDVLLLKLEEPNKSREHATGYGSTMFGRVLAAVTGGISTELSQDLAILERSAADHARAKLSNALVCAGFPVAFWLLFSAGTASIVSPAWLGIGAVFAAGGGWMVTDRLTRQRADARRDEFRSSLVTYLQLVAILLAGGAGTNEALTKVTRFGSSSGFSIIDGALTEARVRGESPWNVFSAVAARKGLGELSELAGAVQLAGASGARVRTSLLTKAESMRQADLAQEQADAGAASESMGVPIGMMMAGFVVLISYPAVVAILSI